MLKISSLLVESQEIHFVMPTVRAVEGVSRNTLLKRARRDTAWDRVFSRRRNSRSRIVCVIKNASRVASCPAVYIDALNSITIDAGFYVVSIRDVRIGGSANGQSGIGDPSEIIESVYTF